MFLKQVSTESFVTNALPCLVANTAIATTALSAYVRRDGMDFSALSVSCSYQQKSLNSLPCIKLGLVLLGQ